MKAEPESRMEKGVDVKFSIDDLAARKVPEPWDGKFLTCLFYSPAHLSILRFIYLINLGSFADTLFRCP